MQKKTVYKLVILVNIFILQFAFMGIGSNLALFGGATDIDEIRSGPFAGNYLVTDGVGAVRIIDLANRKVLWATDEPLFFIHSSDIHPDGKSIFMGDTGRDRVVQMNLSNHEIIWEWNAKNSTHVNWTAFGIQQGWPEDAFAIVEDLNPPGGYYTHLNSVEFINGSIFGRSYDSILISIRNFDLIIEVNYTAKNPSDPGYMNITWHYGIPGDHSIMFHQHAARRVSNGDTSICDSEVGRIIVINQTNQVIWEYWDKTLRWPRDCVYLANGNYLITDSNNNRIIEVNGTTAEISRTFSKHVTTPYSTEVTSDGKLLVGMPRTNKILIIDFNTGAIVDEIGVAFVLMPVRIAFLMIIGFHIIDLIYLWKKMKNKSILDRLKTHKVHGKIILIVALIMVLLVFKYLISFNWHYGIWHLAEQIPRPSW